MKIFDTYKHILFPIVLIFVIFVFFVPLLFPVLKIIVTPDFGQSDSLSSLSSKMYLAKELTAGRIPFWTSLISGGYPIYGNGVLGVWYAPNLFLYSVLPFVVAYNFSIIISLCILGIGMYAWGRSLDFDEASAFFVSVTIALSGYILTQLTHITIVQGLSWFPWIMYATNLLASKRQWRYVGILALFVGQQILIGFPQTIFITLINSGLYFLWLIWRLKHKAVSIIQYALSLVLSISIGAVQLLSSLEFFSKISGSGGFNLGIATYFSFPFRQLLTLINPYRLGNPRLGTYPDYAKFGGSIFWENTIYIGIVPLLVIFLAVINHFITLYRRKKTAKYQNITFFLCMLVLAFLLMTGKHSPLYLLYSVWPFTIFRVPSRFSWIFIISLTILSGYALRAIIQSIKQKTLKTLFIYIILSTHVYILFSTWSSYHALEPANTWMSAPTFTSLVPYGTYLYSINAENRHNETFLPAGWQNTENYLYERNFLTPDINQLWNVKHYSDYAGRTLSRSEVINSILEQQISSDARYATISAQGRKLMTTYGIGAITSAVPIQNAELYEQAVYTYNDKHIYLYTHTTLPHIYIATQIIPVKTIKDAVSSLFSDTFIPGTSVLREGGEAYKIQTVNSTSIQTQQIHDGNYVITITNSPDRGVLVLNQTYFPGWHASIDDVQSEVIPVNVRQIGLELPKGNHRVKMWYIPTYIFLGSIITALGLCITAFLIVYPWTLRKR